MNISKDISSDINRVASIYFEKDAYFSEVKQRILVPTKNTLFRVVGYICKSEPRKNRITPDWSKWDDLCESGPQSWKEAESELKLSSVWHLKNKV